MNALNICLVSPLPPPYGGIAHWGELITRYAKKSSDTKLTVVNTAPRWRSIHDQGIFKRAIGGGLQMLRDLFRLLIVLIFNKVDVVHLTTSGQLAVVRDVGVFLLSACFRTPLVYHVRFGRIPDIAHRNTLEWRFIKFVASYSFSVIAIDELTGSALRNAIPTAHVVEIPNCVDFSGLPTPQEGERDEKIALFVGWVVPTKGIEELLQAWSEVKPDGWKLQIAGPGNPDYISLLKQKHGEYNVEFLGELPHSAAMNSMSQCDVFVLPSYTEGFPNAVLEAMALGKTVIATTVGAIPEMLNGGECGILVDPQDVTALTNAFRLVIADDCLRKSLNAKAQARALQNYSIITVFNSYVSIWNSASSRVLSF